MHKILGDFISKKCISGLKEFAEGENTVSYVRQCGGGLQVRNKFGSSFCQKDT